MKATKEKRERYVCPKCGKQLTKHGVNVIGDILNYSTLGIFEIKRYYCKGCLWTGLRTRFSKKSVRYEWVADEK